ncbi:MAG: sulfate adenylyltransferase subunit 2 [Acidobacteria bacterium]|nr:sulfate adenylyltransferase subunit 2 [Acidobacteriota bacterium]
MHVAPGVVPGYQEGSEVSSATAAAVTSREQSLRLDHLRALEAESIHIIREVVAEFERPVMLYSIGKDSSVLLRLAQKAFYPGRIPFPLLHVDTSYKFREMIEFRNSYTRQIGAKLIVHTNTDALAEGTQPFAVGTQRCCGLLKTKSLLDALAAGQFQAAFGGARRDEERSRAKERVFSLRDEKGQWDPKRQRPELWHLLNARIGPGESIRVFPLSNWTELDVWHYIDSLIVDEQPFVQMLPGDRRERVMCRMRSLGCSPCTGAVRSTADTIPKIIDELVRVRQSERQLRVIDHDQDGSMELKKREGYF